MKNVIATALLTFVTLVWQSIPAAELSMPSVKYADTVKQLEAEVEMAIVYLMELSRCIEKLEKDGPIGSEKWAELEQQLRRILSEKGKFESPAQRLATARNDLLGMINMFAASYAAKFRLGVSETVTTESLRAAINDERKRVVPICAGTPSFRGVLSGDKYTSIRNWFSLPVPNSSNWAQAPFSIQDKSVNNPKANYDLVAFWVKDFGEVLIAGVDYFPDDFIEKNMKQEDHRTMLSKLSYMALHSERSFPTKPKIVEDTYLSTPYGEALLRIYMAEKGSLLVVRSQGSTHPVEERFDTLIAVMVAMQKNNFIYAIGGNDYNFRVSTNRSTSKEALKRGTQSFFASIAVHR